MRPASVVVHSLLFDGHFQMAFVDGDQEVQTLATKTSAEAFAHGVCLRRPHGRSQNPDAQIRHAFVQLLGEDAIPIVDHESVRMVAWQPPATAAGSIPRSDGRSHCDGECAAFPLP